MITGKNVVIVKNEDKTLTVVGYDRVYLEFGPGDPLETYGKTVDGKDLTVDGKVWEGTKPKNDLTLDTSDAGIAALVQAAVDHFNGLEDAKLALDATYKPINGWLIFLEAASYGADLWSRNKLQSNMRPSKPVDKAKAREAMAKKMVASGMAKSLEGAYKKIAAMEAAEDE